MPGYSITLSRIKPSRLWRLLVYSLLIFIFCGSQAAAQLSSPTLTQCDIQALIYRHPAYDSCESTVCSVNSLGGSISTTLPSTVPEPYNTIFTNAAAAFNVNPNYVTAIFITEHHDTWPNPNGPWASSGSGAQGPFQFMKGTFDGYAVDGDRNGTADIQNLTDAAYTAANMLKMNGIDANAPLGDLNKPFVKGTFTRFAAIYNAGPSNIDKWTNGNPDAPLSAVQTHTQNYEYIINAYTVVQSGFTKGYAHSGWGDGKGNIVNQIGSSNDTTGQSSTAAPASCVCINGSSASSPSTSPGAPTIVLDPGHGVNSEVIDSQSGLKMIESNNVPEISEVWDVAQKVKTKLIADGYNVLLTKSDVEGAGVTFRDRANVANSANAAIAVSIHDDHGQNFDSFKQIYPQEVGAYRGSDVEHNKTTFQDAAVAQKSQAYSKIFQQERQKAEGGSPVVKLNSFDGRAPIEPGNIPMVQLFATVPWVYNEVGGGSGNLSLTQEDQYATGLINGIEKSVPVSGDSSGATSTNSSSCANGVVAGNIVDTAIGLAWPQPPEDDKPPRDPNKPTPAYVAAIQQHNPGAPYKGEDCGAFVATVMIASGADPKYPIYGTSNQQVYVEQHPEKYLVIKDAQSTADLQPGDILIVNAGNGQGSNGHTFIYIGPHGNYNEASASQYNPSTGIGRMPSLGNTSGNFGPGLQDLLGRGHYIVARWKG